MGVLPSPSYRLYKFGDLPEWMRHNPSIMTGYRVCISFQQCLQSLFHLHNGTPYNTAIPNPVSSAIRYDTIRVAHSIAPSVRCLPR